jgi:hypothetical protein
MTGLTILIVVASVVVPTGLAIGFVWTSKKLHQRDGRRSPIENRPIYGAGEQLRKRVEDLGDDLMASMAMLFFLGPYFVAVWALQRVDLAGVKFRFGDYLLMSGFAVLAAGVIWRVLHHSKQRRMANAGLKAELYTAQELNRLMAMGCTVLHDVPGEQFNIDHVVIGPRAVYAIETKSVRKPASNDAKDYFKVAYDGQRLRFPDFSDEKRLQQTKRQADWLSSYLQQTLKRKVPVIPALALPGWWIETQGAPYSHEVRVFNPAGRGANFMADAAMDAIGPAVAGLITQALVMRYPASATNK